MRGAWMFEGKHKRLSEETVNEFSAAVDAQTFKVKSSLRRTPCFSSPVSSFNLALAT
jgi:hypothetical protein